MVKVAIRYEGELRCEATHGPSGATLQTDAPVDNHGRGETFSPTDLVATALGTCMLTIMGIIAERHRVDLRGTEVEVTKEMSDDAPRRIAKLTTRIKVPLAPDHPQRAILENGALTCPVHKSLHPDIVKPVDFDWTG